MSALDGVLSSDRALPRGFEVLSSGCAPKAGPAPPSAAMFLQTPASGSIGFGMTVFSMAGFAKLIKDCGVQILAVLFLVQSVLLDGFYPKL